MQQNIGFPRVAYFCMEYGLNSGLPIYAGGLGVLAGDYLKAAHDLNLPMVGIGMLWRHDYTEQFVGEDGWPYDIYPNYDYDFVKDTGITITVQVEGRDVTCKVRLVDQYGNVPLYLLDTNFPGSEHGWITNKLYGGGTHERIAQEILLGIGGVRLLRALNIDVDVYHFNEGHAVLAGCELIREKMEQGKSFEDAWETTRRQVVFTTHTPVEAGNEKHSHGELQQMGAYNGLNYDQMATLGGDPFNMTEAALRLCTVANAVSNLHGHTARSMWRHVADTGPIISITNGVHLPTWQSPEINRAFEAGQDIWKPHMKAKMELIEFARQHTDANLNPEALLVGFARRAAGYKRSDLIFRDSEMIDPLLQQGKIQLVFSGKAHPNDEEGKRIIRDLVKMDQKYKDAVVFLENYNMEIARLLIRGCDVWLNNPVRPLEASGTSGMKAAMNGVLNLSVVDGWVGEGPQHGVSGWLLDVHHQHVDPQQQNMNDLQALYKVLTNEVIPTFYDDRSRWMDMMRASIDMSHYKFSSTRMIREYYELMYRRVMENRAAVTAPWMIPSRMQQEPRPYQQ
ncbi:alpha-glucan family phosphorylase [Dethiobacter alkaliphilus]|uniref:alpha-glucan family phosphorylase n=1 Tax=Dethiobacter alkaliphilus TaxID=427926 RepID=UPI000A0716B8|nr:alpha-glucan family phosphorylase [Dethiobacter alkaliphilus]